MHSIHLLTAGFPLKKKLTLASLFFLYSIYLFSFNLIYNLKNLAACTALSELRLVIAQEEDIVALLLVLIASIILICKSLWIKASAKWLNVKTHDSYLNLGQITICSILSLMSHYDIIWCLILISRSELWPVTEENANMIQMFSAASVDLLMHPKIILFFDIKWSIWTFHSISTEITLYIIDTYIL